MLLGRFKLASFSGSHCPGHSMPGSRPIPGIRGVRRGSIARSAACGSRPRVCTAVTRATLEEQSSARRVRIPPWAPTHYVKSGLCFDEVLSNALASSLTAGNPAENYVEHGEDAKRCHCPEDIIPKD